jgi:hypothetical protein
LLTWHHIIDFCSHSVQIFTHNPLNTYSPRRNVPRLSTSRSRKVSGQTSGGNIGRAERRLQAGVETNRISADGIPTLCTSVVVPGGLPRAIPCLSHIKNPYRNIKTDKVQHLFITLIRVHLFGTCRGTSPTGLNQIERERLAVAPCRRGELHIRRHLERRKSSSPPIRRCRSRSPALCQRYQDLPDKRVCHVSFPTKRQKRCTFYYVGYIPTLVVEGLSKAAKQHSR